MNKKISEILIEDAKHAGVKADRGSIIRILSDYFSPNYSFKYIKLLRKHRYYSEKSSIYYIIQKKIISIKLHQLGTKLGFYIPKDVFGPGLYIPHTGSVVVNPNASVGRNCQINNNVVIGQIKGKAPKIGDNVYIGPGSVISGDITIADNVWIGANAVVTKSITEPNVLVGGIPAKIICKRELNWVEEFSKY